MSEALRFTIPGPPVPKARARVVAAPGKRAHAFTPTRTRAYEEHVGLLALAARTQYDAAAHRRPLGASWWCDLTYAVEIRVARAKGARGDIDNFAKTILDGCNGVLWTDDHQVVHLVVELCESAAPGVDVSVRVRA